MVVSIKFCKKSLVSEKKLKNTSDRFGNYENGHSQNQEELIDYANKWEILIDESLHGIFYHQNLWKFEALTQIFSLSK